MLSFIVELNSKVTLVIGGFLNILLIVLVCKNTPEDMKIYSKLVLQTCVGDLTNLVIGEIVQPINQTKIASSSVAVVDHFIVSVIDKIAKLGVVDLPSLPQTKLQHMDETTTNNSFHFYIIVISTIMWGTGSSRE